MSSYRLASVLVVGLLQACFAAEVVDHKVLAAAHKTYFAKQMINLATRGKDSQSFPPKKLSHRCFFL